MGLIESLRRPSVRVPLMLAALLATSFLAVRSCRDQAGRMRQVRLRHFAFLRLLAASAAETGARPEGLGELIWAPESGGLPALHRVFLRDFAGRPEVRDQAPEGAAPLERLGEVQVWTGEGPARREREIFWAGYLFRLHPAPGSGRDFVVFSWPCETAGHGLTLAWLSTDPERFYYTFSPRYSGPGRGPVPEDLGPEPFAGRLRLIPAGPDGPDPDEFPELARRSEGRLWAVDRFPAPAAAGAAGTR